MRVSRRLVSFSALAIYAVLGVCGQSLHMWSYHAQPSDAGGSCCHPLLGTSACKSGQGNAATAEIAGLFPTDQNPSPNHPPHDSEHCAVCQFAVKAQVPAEAVMCPVWLSLADRLLLPDRPVLALEFLSAFFSRGPPRV